MTREEITDAITELTEESVTILEGEEFDGGVVGTAEVNGSTRLVYDFNKLCDSLVKSGLAEDLDSAADHISYDTMRAMSYMENPLIIIMPLE